jgi:hypothetical protein
MEMMELLKVCIISLLESILEIFFRKTLGQKVSGNDPTFTCFNILIGVKKEFTGHLQKFLASLTEVVYQAKGSTVLYIPNENLDDIEKAATEKDVVQRLECNSYI